LRRKGRTVGVITAGVLGAWLLASGVIAVL
jgi:hypothetical protein